MYNASARVPAVVLGPYDNNVTTLYKWAAAYKVPVRLMIFYQKIGSDQTIFESLTNLVSRMANEVPSEVYDIVNSLNKNISVEDILMVYYGSVFFQAKDSFIELNKVYRSIDNTSTGDRFDNQDDVLRTYDLWMQSLEKEKQKDAARLTAITENQNILAQLNDEPSPILVGPVDINSTVMSFSPTINKLPVTEDDGIDIFDRAVVSKYAPFIRYNDKFNRAHYRIFTGSKAEDEPNYNITIIPDTVAKEPDTIYMTLWLGDPSETGDVMLKNSPRALFFVVIYNLRRNYMVVESLAANDVKKGGAGEEIAYRRTKAAFPSLDFGKGKEVKVRGEFDIYGMKLEETSFLDMILSDPLLNVYLYVEENIKPFATKKRLDVHYRSIYTDISEGSTVTDEAYIANSASVSITMGTRTVESDKIVSLFDYKRKSASQAKLPAGSTYIHINISEGESRAIVDEFVNVFRLLLQFYVKNRDAIEQTYLEVIPALATLPALLDQRRKKEPEDEDGLGAKIGKKGKKAKEGESVKLKALRDRAPEIFLKTEEYARSCSGAMQPTILPDSEIKAWQSKMINGEPRQIMPFPLGKPRMNLVCDSDDYPYPGLKCNDDDNAGQYPLIPCCYSVNQLNKKSKYSASLKGEAVDCTVGAKAEKKITTNKILKPERVAFLPRVVDRVVKRYSDDYTDMVRYGTVYTRNSFLHCVCTAVDDPNYILFTTDEQKEAYVIRLRQHILATIRPALLKQELYDHTDDEIRGMLADPDSFFDPSLFYRAVEETFGINVYVFSPPTTTASDVELGTLEVPRFKIFHSRPPRLERPTVVIIKTWGSESDKLDYPQCELIVDYDKPNNKITKLFGAGMTEICHEALQATVKTLTWKIKEDRTFDVHANLYYHINHLELFQAPAVSQFIDNNGKMRAVTVDLGSHGTISIAIVPSQPENLPVNKNLVRAKAEIATQMFGEPTFVTKDSSGLVDGLWFRIMDLDQGEYVPVVPTDEYDDLPLGAHNPITATGNSVTGRLSTMRRTLNIIVQLVRWLYDLARRETPIDVTTFATNYMVENKTPVTNSSTYYDLRNIPRKLLSVANVRDAIAKLTVRAPSLFNNGRIVMYNAVFADRIIKMLQDYNNLNADIPQDLPEFINNYYDSELDFITLPDSKLFTNQRDMTFWLNSLKGSQNYSRYYNVRRKVETVMGINPDPYIYQDEDGRIFIVQNVTGGNLGKAVAVAMSWYTGSTNPGPDVAATDEMPIHMIYGISASSTIIPIEDMTGDEENFLKILYYGSQGDYLVKKAGRYAAMLEIL
jgi:hypothetical protein